MVAINDQQSQLGTVRVAPGAHEPPKERPTAYIGLRMA